MADAERLGLPSTSARRAEEQASLQGSFEFEQITGARERDH
jgi:hypothetical protein